MAINRTGPRTTPTQRRGAGHRPGRTQEERSAETRAKLLGATIQSLIEVGYQGTTTRRVAELAGVSQGAQTHHFPHRLDLVAAAVEEVAQRRIDEVRKRAQEIPDTHDARLRWGLDLVWADFSGPLFAAMVKLWVAAADEPELARRLAPVERRLSRSIRESARLVLGEIGQHPKFDRRLAVVLSTIRGLALARAFEPGQSSARRHPWPEYRAELERLLRD